MAKYTGGVLGKLKGAIGSVIFTSHLGQDVVKTRGTMSRVGQALGQLVNRAKVRFIAAMPGDNIMIEVKLINKVSMEKTAGKLTYWNWFQRFTMAALTVTDGVVSAVNQAVLRYSKGSLPTPSATLEPVGNQNSVTIALGAAQIEPNSGEALVTSGVAVPKGLFIRPSAYTQAVSHPSSGTMTLPGLAAGDYCIYVWNQNAALTKSSETVYLGEVTVG